MTFGVTPEGFKAKKFEDIFSELATQLNTQLGIDIDSNPDSVAKVLTNILTLALAEEWALPQSLQSMFDIDKAEGVHLDNLVKSEELTRLEAASSFGEVYMTSTTNTNLVAANTEFEDTLGFTYHNEQDFTIGLSDCVDAVIDVDPSLVVTDVISVTLDGILSTQTITTTIQDAFDALIIDINASTSSSGFTALDTTSGSPLQLTVTKVDDKIQGTVLISTTLNLNSVTSFGVVTRDIAGEITVSPNTVNKIPNISSITESTNRYIFVVGRDQETDAELRARFKVSFSAAGACTVDAILADLLNIAGVVSAVVTENTSIFSSTDGLPPKSFLCVVKGGLDQDIVDSIWANKPAGIETHGATVGIVLDSQGNNQGVLYSRPNPIYVHMHVDYQLYAEQSNQFPLDGEEQIIDTCLVYGDSLAIGEDVIPQRFSAEIFNNVGGLGVVNVTAGITENSDDPTPVLTSAIIPIATGDESNFVITRITATEI